MAEAPKRASWGLALAVTVVGAFMAILDSSIVNVAIPHIMTVFGVSETSVQWVVTIYLLALGSVVPLSGWLSDVVGLKRLYILSLVVFTVGSALSAISPSLDFLICARVLQAVGGGMVMPVTMSMVFQMVPRDRMGTAMGIWGLSLLLAPAIGPTVGGYLVEYVDWRWIFTINIPIGVLGSMAAAAALPEFPRGKTTALDIWGTFSSVVGLFALLFALSEGPTWGWGAEATVYLFYVSGVALIFFVLWELYGTKTPLLDLRVFRYTSFTASIIATVVISIGMFSALFFIPIFLQDLRGLTPYQTGLLMMPGALASGILMPVAGRLYDRIGPKLLGVLGFLGLAFGTYLFRSLTADIPTGLIMTWLIIRGLAMGISMMPITTGGMSVIPQELVSRASAVQNITQRVAASFGIAVLTAFMTGREALYANSLTSTVTAASPASQALLAQGGKSGLLALWGEIQNLALIHAMDDVFVIAAAVILAGTVATLFVRRHVLEGGDPSTLASTSE